MNRMEVDRLVAEVGKEIELNPVQDELCKSLTYQDELSYLFNLMGVGKIAKV